MKNVIALFFLSTAMIYLSSCKEDEPGPKTYSNVSIDRFSFDAGVLMVRTGANGLPEADEPINFDDPSMPFLTKGLGPHGELVEYYNFDVQSVDPAPIYVLFRTGESDPVDGQMNIVDVIPGDDGYNDFWEVIKVTVPTNYTANTITSYSAIDNAGYPTESLGVIVNCPIVPMGSTAAKRLVGGAGLTKGWYRDQYVYYFNFGEKELSATPGGEVPTSPIYVSFNTNPDETGGGPASGFVTEGNSSQTHNVVATLPEDTDYSPLWYVNAYDNEYFSLVTSLESAMDADSKGSGLATVNCPVVSIEEPDNTASDPATSGRASIDRFSEDAGTLMVRTEANGLPGANVAIDFDETGKPFKTKGLGPNGELVEYYNFDVQNAGPAPIFVLFRVGESDPVEDQLNIVGVIPGDVGYNDFWQVTKVIVPADYVANTITDAATLANKKFKTEALDLIVNCPVVPEGSSAMDRYNGGDASLTMGWYNEQVVFYFNFMEKELMIDGENVPVSPIYVSFNINPGDTGGGPASGFVTEMGTDQTHNVVATIPTDENYSPFWWVSAYDNAEFDDVMDLESAEDATSVGSGLAIVNCPIVKVID